MLNEMYRKLALNLFGWIVEKYRNSFVEIEEDLRKSDIRILLKVWISIVILSFTISYIVSLVSIYIVLTFFINVNTYVYIFSIVFFPVLISGTVFLMLYLYPKQKTIHRMKSIDRNLPFAINHMAAIASAGIAPEFMFEMLTKFEEYGEIAREMKKIVRNVRNFGMSSSEAIRNVADRTPSKRFREILLGIVTTIESGGDLLSYLKEMADKAIFEYKIEREKYLKTLSTYSDIYTALLVAAPLMMISLLATMSIIGGNVAGFSIKELINILTFIVLPVMNVFYIAFLHITYPGV